MNNFTKFGWTNARLKNYAQTKTVQHLVFEKNPERKRRPIETYDGTEFAKEISKFLLK